jgi:hypothetical protein
MLDKRVMRGKVVNEQHSDGWLRKEPLFMAPETSIAVPAIGETGFCYERTKDFAF